MSVERSRLPFAPAALALALGLAFTAGAHAQSLQELYDAARGYDAAFQSARLACSSENRANA